MADQRLVRPSNNKVIAGVCSGVANYLGLDTTLVRIIFLLAFLLFGAGPLVYLILWLIMPRA
ncbi:MAG: PspC domain-containing protein [Trueperaceae bacterium]|nr:PspC domain-containing protein [Trueperaceae bacterium]